MLQDHVVSEPNVDTAVVKAAMPRRTGQSATQWRQPRGMGVSVHAPVLACLPVVLPCSLLNGPQLPFRRDANETWAVASPKTSTWTVLPRAPKRPHCCSDCHDDEITGADDGWASASWQWPRRQCCLGPARAVLWVCLHASTLARISSSGDPPTFLLTRFRGGFGATWHVARSHHGSCVVMGHRGPVAESSPWGHAERKNGIFTCTAALVKQALHGACSFCVAAAPAPGFAVRGLDGAAGPLWSSTQQAGSAH